jgi:hypothetical protein
VPRFNRLRVTLVMVAAASAVASARPPAQRSPRSDLDAFMEQVLARRDDNWKKLQQYVLDEREEIDLRGSGGARIWGERREYTWYIRDGFFVRSPLVFNGVPIGEAERRQYEDDYLRRRQRRDARRDEQGGREAAPQDLDGFIRQTRDPQFISSAYFLRFRFESGKYALVGREKIEGREALRIEYYPSALFAPSPRRDGERRVEAADEAATRVLLNQGSLVTLWIDPDQHQILRYTLDNFIADLLPVQWLGRLTDLHATMNMGQPFPDVWLPRSLEMRVGLSLAFGPLDLRYALDYHEYRRADVSSVIRIPER